MTECRRPSGAAGQSLNFAWTARKTTCEVARAMATISARLVAPFSAPVTVPTTARVSRESVLSVLEPVREHLQSHQRGRHYGRGPQGERRLLLEAGEGGHQHRQARDSGLLE